MERNEVVMNILEIKDVITGVGILCEDSHLYSYLIQVLEKKEVFNSSVINDYSLKDEKKINPYAAGLQLAWENYVVEL